MQGAVRVIAFALLFAATTLAGADDLAVAAGASLRAKFVALQGQLGDNQFRIPLYLESSEGQGQVAGDVFALVDSRFEAAAAALGAPGDWCDILILHINTKACRVTGSTRDTVLGLWIGSNQPQPLADAFQVDFAYRVSARSSDFLRVGLSAGDGPMGTRDYRIALEAVPVHGEKTFIHLRYAYGYGRVGQMVMEAYLATLGRNKVGFTVIGAQPDGQSRYIGGLRGLVERNAMRYYAAIEAFLGATAGSPQMRFEKRIRDWYRTTERFPRQLHEVGQGEYLDMKRMEYLRQQSGAD